MQKKTRGRRTFPNFVGIIKTVTCGVNNKIVRPVSGMLRARAFIKILHGNTELELFSRLKLKSVSGVSHKVDSKGFVRVGV
jgi:hypothetical protein